MEESKDKWIMGGIAQLIRLRLPFYGPGFES